MSDTIERIDSGINEVLNNNVHEYNGTKFKSVLNQYGIIHGVSKGPTCKIKLAMDTQTGDLVIMKILNEEVAGEIIEEYNVMNIVLKGPNILKFKDISSAYRIKPQ